MKHLPKSRAGFTLIELLVVISIIAILVSLLGAGIFYAFTRMTATGANSEESQMSAALLSFQGQYKCYPPDQLRLCSNFGQYGSNGTNALDQASLSFINRMWPNIGQFPPQDWSGTGNLNVNEVLSGDQVLVWALGGIPQPGNGSFTFTGFSVNPKNPGQLPGNSGNTGRVGPFFNFPSSRVFLKPQMPATAFPSFGDYYQQSPPVPYFYFSANNRKNGYTLSSPPFGPGAPIFVDKTGVQVLVQPYFRAPGNPPQFFNPDTFQIICAGQDGKYGTGGLYPLTSGPAAVPNGLDDITNFNGGNILAAPQ